MREVATTIGYSATTIYLHFEDKDALMLAVCSAGFEEFGASLEAAARSAASPYDGLRASADAYVTFALDHPVLYDVMFIRPEEWALEAPGDPASFRGLTQLVGGAMAIGQLRAGNPATRPRSCGPCSTASSRSLWCSANRSPCSTRCRASPRARRIRRPARRPEVIPSLSTSDPTHPLELTALSKESTMTITILGTGTLGSRPRSRVHQP